MARRTTGGCSYRFRTFRFSSGESRGRPDELLCSPGRRGPWLARACRRGLRPPAPTPQRAVGGVRRRHRRRGGRAPTLPTSPATPASATLTAVLLAEIGEGRARYSSSDAFMTEAGLAPVTRASGRSRRVEFRYAANTHPPVLSRFTRSSDQALPSGVDSCNCLCHAW